jgi:hypothetical protein
MPLLLVITARQFNNGSGNWLKSGISIGGSPYGRLFRGAAATALQRYQQIVAFTHYRAPPPASMVVLTRLFMDIMGVCMRADRVLTAMAAIAATAIATFATAPSDAETAVVHRHPPARVTVHKRSYLDPGTETQHRTNYYSLYSTEWGMASRRNSTLFKNGPSLPFFHDRMPFPTCLDLPGFCQEP